MAAQEGSRTSRAVLGALERLGLDVTTLVASLPFDPREAETVPYDGLAQIWQAARRQSRDPDIPVRAGLAIPFGALGPLDYLSASAPSIAHALEAVASHFYFVATFLAVEVDVDAGTVRTVGRPASLEDAFAFTLAVFASRARTLATRPPRIRGVTLCGPAPRGSRADALFGAPVTYEAAYAELAFDPASLRAPPRGADPALFATLDQLTRAETPVNEGPRLELSVRRALRALVPEGRAQAAEIATRLGLSERTLFRRLRDEGLVLRDLVDGFRRERAERGLLDGRPMSEIATELGYADQSAFSRAFRRWTGASPRAWKQARKPD